MNPRKLPAAVAAALLLACSGDPSDPGGPPDFTRSGSTQGTFTLDMIEIPAGVTITATGPLTLNVDGAVDIAGTLTGDCVPITINGGATVSVTGTIRNACGTLPEDADPPALTLVGNGPMDFDGAEIRTSGELEIKNDPTLTEAEFGALAAAREGAASSATAAASSNATIIGVRNSTFIADPPRARDGIDGQNGTDGRDGANWRLMARGDLVLAGGNEVRGQGGGHGGMGDHTGSPAQSSGGDGGEGGRISVLATSTLSITGPGANVVGSGGGGNGGESISTAMPGPGDRAPDAMSRGGNGGGPGLIVLAGLLGLGTDESLVADVGNGGHGGDSSAFAADGTICVNGHGQHGGFGDARGGNGGSSPDLRFSATGAVVNGDPRVSGGHGGQGGKATVRGGNGADGQNCFDCKQGGAGGLFDGQGGNGGNAQIRDFNGELVGDGGHGGASEHMGGNGGNGSTCCEPTPVEGGHGGAGGSASGGDGVAGTGLNDGMSLGVTISSGDGGNGGRGAPGGDGAPGGSDNTVARGPKDDGDNFNPGVDGEECPPSGTAIAGAYFLSGSLITQSGPCSNPPGITNTGIMIEFDGTNIIINSTAVVSGEYDANTGMWTGTGTSEPNTAGFRTRETIQGQWEMTSSGAVAFQGTITFERLDAQGNVTCVAVYQVTYFRSSSS